MIDVEAQQRDPVAQPPLRQQPPRARWKRRTAQIMREQPPGAPAAERVEAANQQATLGAKHALGLAYHARGDKSAAQKYLEAFLATKPEFEVAVEVRAMLAQLEEQA